MFPLKTSGDVNQLNYKALNKQMLITFLKNEYINFWQGINFPSIQRKLQKSNQVNFFFMPWKVEKSNRTQVQIGICYNGFNVTTL